MKVLGCDPGVHGGLAIVEINDGAVPRLIDAVDIPVTGSGAKERVDVLTARAWIASHQPDQAIIERAQAMPKGAARLNRCHHPLMTCRSELEGVMRRSLRYTLSMLRDAGIEVDYVREATRHTEIILENGGLYRVSHGTHPSRRHERGLRSFIRKFSRPGDRP